MLFILHQFFHLKITREYYVLADILVVGGLMLNIVLNATTWQIPTATTMMQLIILHRVIISEIQNLLQY